MDLPTLKIVVNDAERVVSRGCSVEGLLADLRLESRFLAVEVNRRVIPRGDHRATLLSDGDRVEIVTLVGGG